MLKIIKLTSILIIISITACNNNVTSNKKEKNIQKDYSILFSSQRDIENGELYVMTEDGKNVKRITNNEFSEGYATFSPDKKRIAFSSYRDNDTDNLYLINIDGKNLEQLVVDSSYESRPDWSSSGKQIVYSKQSGQIGGYNIYKTDTTGNNNIEIAHVDATYREFGIGSPDWSRDGSKIAYIKRGRPYRDGQNVYIMNSDGSEKYRLTNDSTLTQKFFNPQWISKNEISVYDDNGDKPQIVKFNIKTGKKEIIVNLSNRTGSLYAWSPKFNQIAYSKYVLGTNGEDGDNEIIIYDLKSGTKNQITDAKGHDLILDWK